MVVDDSIDPVKGASTVDWSTYAAVLFDLDGVITPTAEVHERAWTGLFAPWGFTTDDYLTHVDGKPRYDGVRDFLRSRDVELPFGDPSDDPGDNTICAMGNKKNQLFRTILDRDGVHAYSGSLTLLDHLDRIGLSQAIVSSSKNARSVLSAAGLTDRFSPIVDGVVAAQWQLAGKPAPDMFLRAAELIGVEPESAVVVEDATSGVAAGAAGDFGLVIGVDRGGNREALATHGADLVVDDLIETLPPDERIA
jgi:beta-phosphoglucomutase family hydrolase